MKRVKNFWTAFAGFAIALIMVVGGLQLTAFVPAVHAATLTGEFGISVQLPDTVAYGGTFTVPTAATAVTYSGTDGDYSLVIKRPDGSVYAENPAAAATVTANMVGIYTVTYSIVDQTSDKKEMVTYTYYVECYVENEYQLIVEKSSRIPTVIAAGGKINNMPGFTVEGVKEEDRAAVKVGYYNEKGKWVDLDEDDYTLALYTNNDVDPVDFTKEYEFEDAGSVFFTYVATITKDVQGQKTLTKSFETKVQTGFSDTINPVMKVDNMVSSLSVNQKVTLPKATVSDNADENPEVIIKVEYLNAEGVYTPVKDVKVDKNDIAYETLENNVVFDNDNNMSFYPTEKDASYRITYKTVDDSGNPTSEWTWTIDCTDKKAPIFSMNDQDFPTQWGWRELEYIDPTGSNPEDTLTVYYKDINSNPTAAEKLSLTIPFPTVYDNNDDELTIAFQITDPASRTVVNFSNINQAKDSTGTKASFTIKEKREYEFNNEEVFTSHILSDYIADRVADTDTKAYEGVYTLKYTATDKSSNTSTKTYTINVSKALADTGKVEVSFDDKVSYVVVNGETEFTLPRPTVTSTTDSRVKYDYVVSSGVATFKLVSEDVALNGTPIADDELKGGETVTFSLNGNDTILTYTDEDDNKYTLTVVDEIVIDVTATSIGGNKGELLGTTITVKTADKVNGSGYFTGTDFQLNIDPAGYPVNNKIALTGSYIEIGVDQTERNYAGIGLGVKNKDGKYLSSFSAEIYATGNKMYARNLSFSANTAGVYLLEVEVFDIDGFSTVKIFPITVYGNPGEDGTDYSAMYKLPETGKAYTAVKLNDNPEKIVASKIQSGTHGTEYVAAYAHTIMGGRFAVRGNEFTAYTEGRYQIVGKPVLLPAADAVRYQDFLGEIEAGLVDPVNNPTDKAVNDKIIADRNYLEGLKSDDQIVISDNAVVKFELQERMPSYVATINSDEVVLPQVAAFSTFRAADSVQVEVRKGTDTYDVQYQKGIAEAVTIGSKNLLTLDFDKYFFVPTSDGTYTVTYTVKVGSLTETFQYQVKAGDVIAPRFTLNGSHVTSVSKGHEFTYKQIMLGEGDTVSDITFTKTVIGPEGEVVANSKITGTGKAVADRTESTAGAIVLDESGKYIVRYEATDKAGNTFKQEFEIVVTATSSGTPVSYAVLSAILIIVGVLLILGVIVYLVRYRSLKSAGAGKVKAKKDPEPEATV